MTSLPPLQQFTSSTGARIYSIPVEVFPGFIANCYVILNGGVPTLVDTGSGFGDSNDHLLRGIAGIGEQFSEALDVKDIRRIIITHGHIDHFGGLGFMLDQTGAQVGIHELDQRVLSAYEERVILATKDLAVYLERAGVKPALRQRLMDMYGIAKKVFRSVSVDQRLEEGLELDGMRFIHTPGHCPGQVCIQLGDVLLSADHVLARITPHQSPESIMPNTGLGHYFAALDHISQVEGIRLALGGHEAPISDFYERIEAIRASHQHKLARLLEMIAAAGRPYSISDLSKAMYPERRGYDILLALEEVGAHVEYLYQHGQLSICNLDEIEREDNPALLYGIA